ncbi:MAG: urea ABC transporter permease subunit UrtB, partial [Rhodobacterales bacterium]|nr:urea ABC transporter permease subunit UrtB [Rhodobacterales bacterium]MDX5400999.1 urea ABC transporter permease subunit UrtB [Rhodobacterales bacterium]
MRALAAAIFAALLMLSPLAAQAQTAADILTANRALVEKSSRQTIGPVIAALAASGDPQAAAILSAWADKGLGIRKSDGAFLLISASGAGYALTALDGTDAGTAPKSDITELRPNAGVRGLIATALVQFQLSDPDRSQREAALTAIARDASPDHLAPLRASIPGEPDPV